MWDFEAFFRSEHGRDPTHEEIAAQFQRSRTWVANLKRSEAGDRRAEVAAHLEKPAGKAAGKGGG
jgi:DNA-directed RNA polymerase specialized sigma subunit